MNVALKVAALAVSFSWLGSTALAAGLRAEVMHPWTSGGEAAAVQVFATQFDKQGGVWIDTPVAGNDALLSTEMNRIVGGNPPAAGHFNTGKAFDDLVEAGLLRDFSGQATAEHWDKIIPPTFMKAITRNGKPMAVPINLQTETWMWYSTAAFQKAGISVPQTWDDFFADMDKLRAAGIIPVALGGGSWAERFVFQKVLLTVGGPSLYMKLFSEDGAQALKDPKVRESLETFRRISHYVDEGSASRKWNDATNLVITGKAGVQFMGDWAKGEFEAAGFTPGKEFGCTLHPGPEYSIMSGDVFVFPKLHSTDGTAAQTLLAKVIFAPDTQLAFNIKKGSNPIRQDVDVASMDACARHAHEVIQDPAKQIPTPQFLISNDRLGSLRDVITRYFHNPSVTTDQALAELANVFNVND